MHRTRQANMLYDVSERPSNLFLSPLLNNGDDDYQRVHRPSGYSPFRNALLRYQSPNLPPEHHPIPGYERENIRKPDITSKIEEGDSPVQPNVAAASMLAGSS